RAESRQDVAAIWLIEVPPGIANQARASSPATAPKHLVIAKPRHRIFLVGIYHESRIRLEIVRRPLPDVANHLPASEHAVARRPSADWYAPNRPPVQVRSLGRCRLVAPWNPGLRLVSA